MFMLGTALALLLNYPTSELQRARVDAHAKAALMMARILLAAGAFTGIMKGSGMLAAMAGRRGRRRAAGARAAPAVRCSGSIAMPLSLLFDPDSFYLGALPVVAEVARTLGVPPIQVGQAALLGQMTTGFPVSPLTPATFLRRRPDRHRARRAPALHRAVPVRGLASIMTFACVLLRSVSAVKTIRIGCGAGYSGDRIEPAVELAERGELDYLVFECLAERTIALAQQARARDPHGGYDPLLVRRMRGGVAGVPSRTASRIITNMGAANPRGRGGGASSTSRARCGARGLADRRRHRRRRARRWSRTAISRCRRPASRWRQLGDRLVSANAYIGAEPIVEALAGGADVVITGRAADPSLFVAPLAHEFGWSLDDWPALGRGTLVGHLLECAGQVTGGYFADPGCKDVRGLARLGFPIAEVPERRGRSSSPRSRARAGA